MFFSVSKIAWKVFAPGNLFLLLLLAGVVAFRMDRVRLAKRIFSTVVFLLVLIALFPVGNWLLFPLERSFPMNPDLPEQVDGIIVLSGAVNAKATALTGQAQVNEQVDRELAFMRLAREYPEAKLLYSGGSSSLTHQNLKGADAGKQLLIEQGVDLDRVVFERDSRNTSESAQLSKKKVGPDAGESWVLITTAWHMPRSVGTFCMEGWSVIPYPVDYRAVDLKLYATDFSFVGHLLEFEVAVKEWLGLLAYWATDRIPSIFPSRC